MNNSYHLIPNSDDTFTLYFYSVASGDKEYVAAGDGATVSQALVRHRNVTGCYSTPMYYGWPRGDE